jgi:hypothetical protein
MHIIYRLRLLSTDENARLYLYPCLSYSHHSDEIVIDYSPLQFNEVQYLENRIFHAQRIDLDA